MKKFFGLFLLVVAVVLLILYASVVYTTNHFLHAKTAETRKRKFIAPDTTEVYVLGVLHQLTPKVGYDSLYNVLERIKPDLILFEFDSSGFDKDMNLTTYRSYIMPRFLKRFEQVNVEQMATRKYIYHNPFAKVRPYEWQARDAFHKRYEILTKPDEIFATIDRLYAKGLLTSAQKGIIDTYGRLSEELNAYGDSSLYEINTRRQDSIAAQRQNYQYHEVRKIVEQHDSLKQYRAFYKVNEAYWNIRNKAMADNILKYIRLYPRSRIVVLNGYFHRYYLIAELERARAARSFRVIDAVPRD